MLGVYKNLDITFKEMDEAMARLKFQKKVVRSNDTLKEEILGRPIMVVIYFNKKDNPFYEIYERSPEDYVPKYQIASLSDWLYQLGYVEHHDDFVKTIEKERLSKRSKPAAHPKLQPQRLTE